MRALNQHLKGHEFTYLRALGVQVGLQVHQQDLVLLWDTKRTRSRTCFGLSGAEGMGVAEASKEEACRASPRRTNITAPFMMIGYRDVVELVKLPATDIVQKQRLAAFFSGGSLLNPPWLFVLAWLKEEAMRHAARKGPLRV